MDFWVVGDCDSFLIKKRFFVCVHHTYYILLCEIMNKSIPFLSFSLVLLNLLISLIKLKISKTIRCHMESRYIVISHSTDWLSRIVPSAFQRMWEGTVFTLFVCPLGGGGGTPASGSRSLVSGPFWGRGVVSQSCQWSCPKSCSGS